MEMNKPITEKDFQRISDFYGIGPAKIYYKLNEAMFNEAKRMAIDFHKWYRDEIKNQKYPYPLATLNPEQLFELYQQQKQ